MSIKRLPRSTDVIWQACARLAKRECPDHPCDAAGTCEACDLDGRRRCHRRAWVGHGNRFEEGVLPEDPALEGEFHARVLQDALGQRYQLVEQEVRDRIEGGDELTAAAVCQATGEPAHWIRRILPPLERLLRAEARRRPTTPPPRPHRRITVRRGPRTARSRHFMPAAAPEAAG